MRSFEDIEEVVREKGGVLLRSTAAGHHMYQLGSSRIVIPKGGAHHDYRATKNLWAQVQRALRAQEASPVATLAGPSGGPPSPPGAPSGPGVAIDIAPPAPPPGKEEIDVFLTPPPNDPKLEEELPAMKCPECVRNFQHPQALGRHRLHVHGVVGTSRTSRINRAKKAPTQPPKPVKVPDGTPALDQLEAAVALLQEAIQGVKKEYQEIASTKQELNAILGPLMEMARAGKVDRLQKLMFR